MSGTSERNPFVGPRPIQQGEALHGRDAEVRELFNQLQARRIVVLHSPSGAGKSSLVHAGLIPRLQQHKFDVWKPIRLNLDLRALAGVPPATNRYLLSAMVSLEDELPAPRRRSPAELAGLDFAAYLDGRPRRKGRADRPRVLLFDQFEEVLTIEPRALAEKRAFFTAIGAALDRGDAWALFIIREDYLAALAPYRDHIPTQLANTFRLDLLGLAGAREAAERLALAGGRSFPAVDQLVRDLATIQVQQPDGSFIAEQGLHVEPVHLQVVGRRMWEAMPEGALSIDAEDIARYADVSTALREYYAQAVQKIAGGDRGVERAIREWVGGTLIVAGLRSQIRQDAGATAGLDNARITALVDSYLVRAEPRVGATWFELSHDRMVEPITRDNQAWEQQNLHPLQVQAQLWERARRPQALLMSAAALTAATAWALDHAALLTPGEQEFLALSQQLRDAEARSRRRQRVFMALLAAVAVVTTTLGALARQLRSEAEAARERARGAAWMGYVRTFASTDPTRALLGLGEVRAPAEVVGWLQETVDTLQQPHATALLQGHRGWVLAAAFSGDGTRVVTASYDGTARVWRVDGDAPPAVLRGHQGPVRSAAFSPDGARVVTASEDRTARVWAADGTGEPVVLAGHPNARTALSASFSPDGRRVLMLSRRGGVRVWDAGGRGLPVDRVQAQRMVSARFGPDGRTILTTAEDGAAWQWSADGSGPGLGFSVLSEADSPDGRSTVIVAQHGPVRVVPRLDRSADPATRDARGIELKNSEGMSTASFGPDGTTVIAANSDYAWEWNADGSGERRFLRAIPEVDPDGVPLEVVRRAALLRPNPGWGFGVFVGEVPLEGAADPMYSATYSADGARVVTVRKGLARLWRADGEGPPVTVARGGVLAATFSRDGERVMTFSADEGGGNSVEVWDTVWGDAASDFAGHGGPLSATFGVEGKRVMTFSAEAEDDHAIQVWDADVGPARPAALLRGHRDTVSSAIFSPDGRRGLTTARDGAVRVWDLDGERFAGRALAADSPVKWAAFSADGRRVATVAADHAVQVWDADGGGPQRTLVLPGPAPTDAVMVASLDPGGRRVATGGAGTAAWVWDVDGGAAPTRLAAADGHDPRTSIVLWATFSPDGGRILTSAWASERPVVRVWDARGGRGPVTLAGHTGVVQAGAFRGDGQRVVTGSDDATARVWRLDDGGEAIVLAGHLGPIRSVAFSPDGRRVLTGSDDATARLWDLDGGFVALTEHHRPVYSAAFSPDGRYVLTASEDGRAVVWSAAGERLAILEAYKQPVSWAAFAPDGERVITASAGGVALIWSVDGSGAPLTLRGHQGAVNWAAFHPDGAHVVTASDDHSARLWTLDVAALQEVVATASSGCVLAEDRVQFLGDSRLEACEAFAACERAHGRTGPARAHDGSWVDWPRCRAP